MTPGHGCIPLMCPPALRPCGTCQPFPGAGQPGSPGCGPHRHIRYDGSLRTQHRPHYQMCGRGPERGHTPISCPGIEAAPGPSAGPFGARTAADPGPPGRGEYSDRGDEEIADRSRKREDRRTEASTGWVQPTGCHGLASLGCARSTDAVQVPRTVRHNV